MGPHNATLPNTSKDSVVGSGTTESFTEAHHIVD